MESQTESKAMSNQQETSVPATGLGLRTKLVFGFVGLLAILIAVGVESISLLSELGGSIDVILRENYASVLACDRMKEALERLDSAALFALAGETQKGRELAAENRPRFAAALQAELGNITETGEGERAARLRQLYDSYAPALERVLAAETPDQERHAVYFSRLLPDFQQIKTNAEEILELNQQSMVAARDQARGLAAAAGRRMAILLLVGTAFAGLCVFFLSRAILGPLERLTWAARRIEGGDLDLSVPVASRDELGQLAAAFNFMTGGLRDLRESDQAHLLQDQRAARAEAGSLRETVAVLSNERQRVGEMHTALLAGTARDLEAALAPLDVERLREIAANLYGISRLEGNLRQLHLKPAAPADLVEAAVGRVEEEARGENVKLVTDISPAAPRVLADPERAGMVLFSLLKNAVAHTSAGGTVTVRAEPHEDRARFTVADTGRGIPSAHLDRIFEPLYQVPGTEDLGGAGIGLTLAKNIVQAHGGEICCTSEEGRGTVFWFTLPAASYDRET
jgi:signal transduction histidine kinase